MATANLNAHYRGGVSQGPGRDGAGEDRGAPRGRENRTQARGADRPQSRDTVMRDVEAMRQQARGSPFDAPEGGILSELRVRMLAMNRELPAPSIARGDEGVVAQGPGAMGPPPTGPDFHYRVPVTEGDFGQEAAPGSEEGRRQDASTEPRIRGGHAKESEVEGHPEGGWRDGSMPSEWDWGQAPQPSEEGPVRKMNQEIITELKVRIATMNGEILEPSGTNDQTGEAPLSPGTGSQRDSASERWWPYIVGLIIFVGLIVSAGIYISVRVAAGKSN